MDPSEIRERILAERRGMNDLLDEAKWIASGVLENRESYRALHSIAIRLEEALSDLFHEEEEILEPALRDIDAWGEVRASRLEEHHHFQRMAVHQSCAEVLEGRLPARRAAEELLELLDAVNDGLARSERTFLGRDLLRDDLVSIRQSGG